MFMMTITIMTMMTMTMMTMMTLMMAITMFSRNFVSVKIFDFLCDGDHD